LLAPRKSLKAWAPKAPRATDKKPKMEPEMKISFGESTLFNG